MAYEQKQAYLYYFILAFHSSPPMLCGLVAPTATGSTTADGDDCDSHGATDRNPHRNYHTDTNTNPHGDAFAADRYPDARADEHAQTNADAQPRAHASADGGEGAHRAGGLAADRRVPRALRTGP